MGAESHLWMVENENRGEFVLLKHLQPAVAVATVTVA